MQEAGQDRARGKVNVEREARGTDGSEQLRLVVTVGHKLGAEERG